MLGLVGLCGLVPSAGAAELYYTNRTYSNVVFNLQGEPTVLMLHSNSIRLTNVVKGAAIVTNPSLTRAIEKEAIAVSFVSVTDAWNAAVTYEATPSNYPGKIFDNVGWVRGTRLVKGEWGAYLWTLQNRIAFRASETNWWISPSNGPPVRIKNVIVGSLGIYGPREDVVDEGPKLTEATNSFPDQAEAKEFHADLTNVFYVLAIPEIWITPRYAFACAGGSNVQYMVEGTNIPNGVNWTIIPPAFPGGATIQPSNDWHYAGVTPGNIATNYKVRATSVDNPNFSDEVSLGVRKVDIVETNIYLAVSNTATLHLSADSSANVQWEFSPFVPGGAFIVGSPFGTSLVLNAGSVPTNYTVRASAFDLTTCYDTCTVVVLKVGMTAYRPTTELQAYGHPFAKHEVPDNQEENPGAGIRVNGDTELPANENDLIEVELKAEPYPTSSGFTYVLKRSNSNIKVWDSQTMGTAILDSGTEATITFSAATKTVWIENPNGGAADLEVIARLGATGICSDKIHFYPFSNVVVLFEGEFGVPSDPPGSGISTLALSAYTNGYDVHVYDEPDIGETPNTENAAFAEIDSAVEDRGVTAVAVIGYSHGGGSTYRISERMDADATAFNLVFTAYIDAITQPLLNITAEERRPVGSAFHVNYFQVAQWNDSPMFLDGAPSTPAGAGFEDNVDHPTVTESHTSIDDAQVVQDGIRTRLFQQVNR